MKFGIFIIFIPIFFSKFSAAQDAHAIKFVDLENILDRSGDTTYVVNFWATWCSPCVEELPYFEAVYRKRVDAYGQKLKVILVSLDFKSQLETRVKPFLRMHEMNIPVLLLDESDGDSFIDKVNPAWSGALPATLVVNRQKNIRQFYEKKFESQEELESIIHSVTERN